MKKIYLILYFALVSFLSCLGQSNMPYFMRYSYNGDTIYHNISNLRDLFISPNEHELRNKEYEREETPISQMDTVFIYQDHFKNMISDNTYWDEIAFSTEQIYFYKESKQTGLPSDLLIVMASDTLPDGKYLYVSYNVAGIPNYINFNGDHFFYVEDYYNDYANVIIINSDSSFFSLDSLYTGWSSQVNSKRIMTRSGYTQTNLQNGVSLLNHAIGGATMMAGGFGILVGCSMLVPGANIAVGSIIALAGTATFISGALTTARATDQLISDGTHTEGFDVASLILGSAGTVGGLANGASVAETTLDLALNGTWEDLQKIVDQRADYSEAYNRTKNMMESRLTAGSVQLIGINEGSVRINANVTRKMNPNDYWGIFISKDEDALKVNDCATVSNAQTGNYHCDFSGLEQVETYYYRAYYYASEFENTEFNPNFVSGIKSFIMPGVKTLTYTPVNKNEYNIRGKVVWNKSTSQRIVGICYSTTKENPTISDAHSELEFSEDGTYTINVNLDGELYYYRAYAYMNGEIVYGKPDILTNERLILEKFYRDTNGDSWTNNKNWCSDKPLNEWYGVSMDGNFVNYIDLTSNNLTGSGTLRGMKVLHDLWIENNNMESITISDCPNFQICYHSLTTDDKLKLKSYNITNCGKSAAYVDFYDIFSAAEEGYTCYYTHENWLGSSNARTEIDTIRINHHYSCHQTFFNNLSANYIEFQNLEDFGRIFFEDVSCDVISFKNCIFPDQGIIIKDYNSTVNTLILDNVRIEGGGFGNASYYKIYNTTFGESWGNEYITIPYFEGTHQQLMDYLYPDDNY